MGQVSIGIHNAVWEIEETEENGVFR